MDLAVIALTFAAIFVVELPDKTFLATLVLATKYRPILVWIGVGLAFTVQTIVAVLLGHAVSFLPDDLVHAAAALMFLAGAVILIREGRSHQANEGEDIETVRLPLDRALAMIETGEIADAKTIILLQYVALRGLLA